MSVGLFFHVCFSFLSWSLGFCVRLSMCCFQDVSVAFGPTGRPAAPCRDSSSKCDLTQHLASFMPEWVVSTSACIAVMAVMSHHSVNHVQDDGEADDLLRRVQSARPSFTVLVTVLLYWSWCTTRSQYCSTSWEWKLKLDLLSVFKASQVGRLVSVTLTNRCFMIWYLIYLYIYLFPVIKLESETTLGLRFWNQPTPKSNW